MLDLLHFKSISLQNPKLYKQYISILHCYRHGPQVLLLRKLEAKILKMQMLCWNICMRIKRIIL